MIFTARWMDVGNGAAPSPERLLGRGRHGRREIFRQFPYATEQPRRPPLCRRISPDKGAAFVAPSPTPFRDVGITIKWASLAAISTLVGARGGSTRCPWLRAEIAVIGISAPWREAGNGAANAPPLYAIESRSSAAWDIDRSPRDFSAKP